jgi:ankyrin repeat protein
MNALGRIADYFKPASDPPKRDNSLELVRAVRRNDLQTVEIELAKGADPESHDKRDRALMIAARYDYTEIAQRLLQAGAKVHAHEDYMKDFSALKVAVSENHPKMVALLLEADPGHVDARSPSGSTALHDALNMDKSSDGKYGEVVRTLLRAGANPSLREEHAQMGYWGDTGWEMMEKYYHHRPEVITEYKNIHKAAGGQGAFPVKPLMSAPQQV